MSCLVWNCQGLGNLWTVRELGDLIHESHPHIIFLMETRLRDRRVDRLKEKFNLFGFSVAAQGKSGGLALLWAKDTVVTLQNFSRYHIDCLVQLPSSNICWRFTGFYGEPDVSKRKLTWDLLCRLSSLSSLPWVCIGDFNEVLSHNDKSGGKLVNPSRLRDFRTALQYSGLVELGFKGYKYTWTNKRLWPHTIRIRLDRGLATPSWSTLFPHSTITHIDTLYSDHSALLLRLDDQQSNRQGRKRGFKFEAMWTRHIDCGRIVAENWPATLDFQAASVQCRRGLSIWGRSAFGSVTGRIRHLKGRICGLQSQPLTSEVRDEIQSIKNELEELFEREQLMWLQRSKLQWARDGDRNTHFFHQQASRRLRKNEILGLKDSEGNLVSDITGMGTIAVDYFRHIFSSSHPTDSAIDAVLKNIVPKVTQEINTELCQNYSADEVNCDDVQVWSYSKTGSYTVKTGYRLAMKIKMMQQGNLVGSVSSNDDRSWCFVWNLKIPAKVCHFLWRALHGFMPTGMELLRRHLLCDAVCPVCGQNNEDLLHVLRDCPFARQVWALANFPSRIIYISDTADMWEWISKIRLRLDKDEFERFVVSCWSLWYNRTQISHEEDWKATPMESVCFVQQFLAFHRHSRSLSENRLAVDPLTSVGPWCPPPSGCMKINFDAAVPRNGTCGSVAAVCRDSAGYIIAWKRQKLQGIFTVLTAELMAAKLGIELGIQLGYKNIILEGDALLVIKDLAAHGGIGDPINGALYTAVYELIKEFDQFDVSHIRRDANQLAHKLCHMFSSNALGFVLPFEFEEPG